MRKNLYRCEVCKAQMIARQLARLDGKRDYDEIHGETK